MSDSNKSIKDLIRTGQFSKRLNFSKSRRSPDHVLSTIESVGSVEEDDDAHSTDIEDHPADKTQSGSAKESKKNNKSKSKEQFYLTPEMRDGLEAIAQQAIRAGLPVLVSNPSRKSTASNRTSRTSISSSRSSSSSATFPLPTIKEIPGLVDPQKSLQPDGITPIPNTPPASEKEFNGIPVIAPPPGFTPISCPQCTHSDAHSVGSTLVQTPPRADGLMITDGSTPPPQAYHHTSAPPQSSYSDASSEKKGSSSYSPSTPASSYAYSIPDRSPPSYSSSASFAQSNPQSRFSWHMTNTDKAKSWWTRWFVEWWGLEILSLAFSAICMTIILIVLALYDGKEIPKWKIGITINAFISIFSGFAKSALLLPTAEALGQLKWNWFTSKPKKMMDFEVLDSASRGPWGSFVLLARTKGITLASVGAAVILLSLPLDLFFQQIVQYPTVWVTAGNSTINRSVHYNPVPNEFNDTGAITWGADQFMFNTVDPMITGQGLSVPNQFDCPTGRCTFEPFDTLAVCSSCVDVDPSSVLEFGCKTVSGDWKSGQPGTPEAANTTTCGWYFQPDDDPPILVSGYSMESATNTRPNQALAGRFLPLRDAITRSEFRPGGTINFKNVTNPIADFLVAFAPNGGSGAFLNQTPSVNECVINWCINTIQSTVKNGILTENVTHSRQPNTNNLDMPWTSPTDYMPTFNLSLPDAQGSDSGFSNFGIGNLTARQTIQAAEYFAPSSWLLDTAGGQFTTKVNWREPHYRRVAVESTPWLGVDGVASHLRRISDGMSVVVRRTPVATTAQYDTYQGTAWEQMVRIDIRWAWIVLPAILLVISLVFLVLTVVKSSKEDHKIGVWKTSALAVLFNGLGEDVQDQTGSNLRMGQQRKAAKNLTVHLDD